MKKLIALILALTIIASANLLSAQAAAKPAAPKLVTVKNTAQGVLLKWSASKNAVRYKIFRRTATAEYKKIAAVKTTSFIHKNAVSGTKYTYKIVAYNSAGSSKASNLKSVLRVGTPTLNTTNTASAVRLSWSKVRKADRYVLLGKKSSAQKFAVLYRGKNASFEYSNIASGASYEFKVKAVIGKQNGVYSAVKTQLFLERPALLAEEKLDMKGITLEWSKIKNARGYIILRSLKKENSYSRIAKFSASDLVAVNNMYSYIDTDVESINSYKYRILSFNGAFKSAKSDAAWDIYGKYEGEAVPLTLTIDKGETFTDIRAKIESYGALSYFTWDNQDKDIISVDSNAVITGLRKGTATVRVTLRPVPPYTTESKHATLIVTVR